ncbi:MAG: hypothetical protein KDE14_14575 [Rhodobacteraceae bacterium]|nr:hypothetical protein [Paracoccaceae bacterium]
MTVTSLSYERMVEDALRGVLRQALRLTERQGLPGSHHFYITFDTTHRDVRIPEALRALHPNEMTIVLQHQFWDLKVEEEKFSITLSFSGVSHHLVVPFAAVTAFADPHAKFGLQFHVEFEEKSAADEDAEVEEAEERAATQPQVKSGKDRKTPHVVVQQGDGEDDAPANDGKVVTLDAFRKK